MTSTARLDAPTLVPLLLLVAACAAEAPPPETPRDVETQQLRVRVGEVSASDEGPAALESLRGALGALAQRLHDDERLGRELVLNGAVTGLERRPSGGGVTVRATVSLSVSDASGGQILVVLNSTAQSTGPVPANDAERDDFDREVISGTVESLGEQLGPRLGEL